jgi:hypothetical protein
MSDRYGSITISSGTPAPDSKKPDKPVPKRLVPSTKKKTSNTRVLLFVISIVFCAASYFMVGSHLVPMAVKKYLPGYIEDKTGLSVSIGEVRLNPFNFQLNIDTLIADHPDSPEESPLLQIKSLFIDLDLTALIRNTFVCDKLTIQNLHLNLIRHKDKTYNIPALSQFSTTQEQGAIIAFSKLPFLFSLNNIDINDSSILFTDALTNKTHTIERLHLAIPTLSNFPFQSKNYIKPHFSAIINGSPVKLSGEAVQLAENQGFQTKLSCSIESLDLTPYFSYLPDSFPLSLTKGKADTKLQITFSPNKKQGDRLSIDIKMTAADLAIEGKNNTLQLVVPAMELDAVLMPIGRKLHIRSIITKKPHLTWSRQQLNSSLQNVLFHLQSKKKAPFTIQVDQLLSDLGQCTLLSENDPKSVISEWNNIQLSIRDLSSGSTNAIINLSGEHTDKQASFSWQSHFSDTGTLQGKILLQKLPAITLLDYLVPNHDNNVQGIATFSGDINFPVSNDSTFSYSVDRGIVEINNLTLSHKTDLWLQAGSLRFTQLTRTNDRYNLGNIFLKKAALTLNPADLPPLFNHLFSEDKRPLIEGIDFSGSITVKTEAVETNPFEISAVTFQINNLEKAGSTDNFAFSGQVGPDGIIKAEGLVNLAPMKMQAKIAFSEIDSDLLAPFVNRWPLLKNSRSTLHGKGTLYFPKPTFQGFLRLTDTSLQIVDEEPLFQWKLAELHKAKLSFSPFSLEADTVGLDNPNFQWVRDTVSPFQQLQKGLQTFFQNKQDNNKLFPITIKKLIVKNGSVNIDDKRLPQAWTTDITNIEGHINNLTTSGNGIASFTLNGIMEESSLLLSGSATLFNSTLEAHANLQLTDFPLVSFYKQIPELSLEIESATLDLHTNMTENQSGFSSKNEIFIYNLKPSLLASDSAIVLALLKNSEGALPMNIEIDDSNRNLLQESIASFQTTTIKASYAPLLLLDYQFKDLQGKDFIPFEPGSNQIDTAGLLTLARYAELLENRPGIGLIITGMADWKIDHDVLLALLKTQEQQRTDTENEKRDLAGFTPLLPEPVVVADEALLDLAKERGLLVLDACIHSFGIARNQIFVKENKEQNNTGNTPSHGARITIKAIATGAIQ